MVAGDDELDELRPIQLQYVGGPEIIPGYSLETERHSRQHLGTIQRLWSGEERQWFEANAIEPRVQQLDLCLHAAKIVRGALPPIAREQHSHGRLVSPAIRTVECVFSKDALAYDAPDSMSIRRADSYPSNERPPAPRRFDSSIKIRGTYRRNTSCRRRSCRNMGRSRRRDRQWPRRECIDRASKIRFLRGTASHSYNRCANNSH